MEVGEFVKEVGCRVPYVETKGFRGIWRRGLVVLEGEI